MNQGRSLRYQYGSSVIARGHVGVHELHAH